MRAEALGQECLEHTKKRAGGQEEEPSEKGTQEACHRSGRKTAHVQPP